MRHYGVCNEGSEVFCYEPGSPSEGLGGWVAAEDDYFGDEHPTVVKACSKLRKFPMSPAVFSHELDNCTFTNGAVP